MPNLFLDEFNDLSQAGRDDVVIVIAESIGGNPHSIPHPWLHSLWERGMIWHCQHKDGFTFGQDLFWVGAADAAAFFSEILHCAVLVLAEPFFKDIEVRGSLGRSNASQDESQLARFFLDGLFERYQLT